MRSPRIRRTVARLARAAGRCLLTTALAAPGGSALAQRLVGRSQYDVATPSILSGRRMDPAALPARGVPAMTTQRGPDNGTAVPGLPGPAPATDPEDTAVPGAGIPAGAEPAAPGSGDNFPMHLS